MIVSGRVISVFIIIVALLWVGFVQIKTYQTLKNTAHALSLTKLVHVSPLSPHSSRYALQSALDPIFALEGTDPDALSKSIVFLNQSVDNLEEYFTRDELQPLKEAYPRAFLESLPLLERARQHMIASPNIFSILYYEWRLQQSIQEYNQALTQTITVLRTGQNNIYYSIQGAISEEFLAQQLVEIRMQLGHIKEKRMARILCFFGRESMCEDVSIVLSNVVKQVPLHEPIAEVPQSMKDMAAFIQPLYEDVMLENRIYVTDPLFPLVYLPDSVCTPSKNGALYLTWRTDPSQSMVASRISAMNDFLLINLSHQERQSFAEFRNNLPTDNKDHYIQWLGNIYSCPNAGYEQTRSVSLLSVANTYGFQSSKETNILNEQELIAFINTQLKEVSSTTALTPDLLNSLLILHNSSAHLDETLVSIAAFIGGSDYIFENLNLAPRDIFTTRFAPSVLFMFYNPSFVGSLSLAHQFSGGADNFWSGKYSSYAEYPNAISQEEILSMIRFQRSFMAERFFELIESWTK